MNKWFKSLAVIGLASSLFMVGCGNGEEEKKEEDTMQQEDTETNDEVKDNESSESEEK